MQEDKENGVLPAAVDCVKNSKVTALIPVIQESCIKGFSVQL